MGIPIGHRNQSSPLHDRVQDKALQKGLAGLSEAQRQQVAMERNDGDETLNTSLSLSEPSASESLRILATAGFARSGTLTPAEGRRRRLALYEFLQDSGVLLDASANRVDPSVARKSIAELAQQASRGVARGAKVGTADGGAVLDDADGGEGLMDAADAMLALPSGLNAMNKDSSVLQQAKIKAGDARAPPSAGPRREDCCSDYCSCMGNGGGVAGLLWRGLWPPQPKLQADPLAPVRRHDAPFTCGDVARDALRRFRAPCAWLCCRGLLYGALRRMGVCVRRENRTGRFQPGRHALAVARARSTAWASLATEDVDEELGDMFDEREGAPPASPEDRKALRGDGKRMLRRPSSRAVLAVVRAEAAQAGGEDPSDETGPSHLWDDYSPEQDLPEAGPSLGAYFDDVWSRPSTAEALRAGWHSSLDQERTLQALWDAEEALSREYYEEVRAAGHVQLLLLAAARARVTSEAVVFAQFLREFGDQLRAAHLSPPGRIFASKSFATVDVRLVASWMITLTPEQRRRFATLRARFAAEFRARTERQRFDDSLEAERAERILASHAPREQFMAIKRAKDFAERRRARARAGIEIGEEDEDTVNDREFIQEVEHGHRSCVPGLDGRSFQFQDPDFSASAQSVGALRCAKLVGAWKPSINFNPRAGLFEGGTDPDDVFQGVLDDGWLLSAISIVAASGGVGDREVDALIDNLFVTKATSNTGLYALRLWKNGQWETVYVDDRFPTLLGVRMDDKDAAEGAGGGGAGDDDKADGTGAPKKAEELKLTVAQLADMGLTKPQLHRIALRSAGAAFAHSRDFGEIWVALIEKAFAKYHGSFAALEAGCVQHALTALTGAQAEEVFLGAASHGANRAQLWTRMREWRSAGFLLGAGSVSAASTSHVLLESGLVFGNVYTVYDVRELDGHKLLKLRNPPGDHGEWNGDWSDASPLWTRRMRTLLHMHESADDGTFWMSFDDFCSAFRSLYVCRWCGDLFPSLVTGFWAGPTAAGLPSRHNQGCKVHDNPQFSLVVDRPTQVHITLTQSIPGLPSTTTPHPVAVFVIAHGGDGPSQSDLAAEARRRRIERAQRRAAVLAIAGLGDELFDEDGDGEDGEDGAGDDDAQPQEETEAERMERELGLRQSAADLGLSEAQMGKMSPRSLNRHMKMRRKELKKRRDELERRRNRREAAREQKALRLDEWRQVQSQVGREVGLSATRAALRISKAERVYALTASSVVAATNGGKAVRDRSVTLSVTLEPRAYTILCATYQRGMEGPFTLDVRSSEQVLLSCIWPPIRDRPEDRIFVSDDPITRASLWLSAAWRQLLLPLQPVDHAATTARLEESAEGARATNAMDDALHAARDAAMLSDTVANKSDWVELLDSVKNRPYFYNMRTRRSQFTIPDELAALRAAAADEAGSSTAAIAAAARKRRKMKLGVQRDDDDDDDHDDEDSGATKRKRKNKEETKDAKEEGDEDKEDGDEDKEDGDEDKEDGDEDKEDGDKDKEEGDKDKEDGDSGDGEERKEADKSDAASTGAGAPQGTN